MIDYLTGLDTRYLITGTIVILTSLLWLLKMVMRRAPELDALRILEGSDRFTFKAANFTEKRFCRKPITRICKDVQIEVYSIDSETYSIYRLSQRKPTVPAIVEPEEPIQIRFKYKDGLFWTAWSEIIEKVISRAPFRLKVFEGHQGNQAQPDNGQEQTEERFFTQLYENLRNRINNSERVIIRFVGRIGIGKSSLINTMFYAWTREWRERATSYGGNESITRDVRKYELIEDRIWLGDMPGFQGDSCFEYVPDVIDGSYDGMQLELNKPYRNVNDSNQLDHSRIRQRTSMILVLDPEDINGGESVNKKIIAELIKRGYPCIAVVTKVDNLRGPGEGKIDEDNFYTDARVIDCCNKLRNIGVNTVIPIMNYRGTIEQHYKIDYVALQILQKAIELAH